MSLPPKAVSTLCVLQSAVIAGSILLVKAAHKVYESATLPKLETYAPKFSPLAQAILSIGASWLLIPASWGLVTTLTADTENGIAFVSDRQTIIGCVVTAIVLLTGVLGVAAAFASAFPPPPHITIIGP